MHAIHVDRAAALVEVRLAGFFTPEQAEQAAEEVRAAIRSLGDKAGGHLTLYDVTEVQIAPGETIALLQGAFANPHHCSKVAFCTPSALARLQLGRLREARSDIGIFEDREVARAWLLG